MAKKKTKRKTTTKKKADASNDIDIASAIALSRELFNIEPAFDSPGELHELAKAQDLNPGMKDIQLVQISRLGHRDKFPRPHDWEKLIPFLKDCEELLWIIDKRDHRYSFYLGLKTNERTLADRREAFQRQTQFRVITDSFARRAFPESHVTLLKNDKVIQVLNNINSSAVMCVTGSPSPKRLESDQLTEDRDEERRPFAGLNDVVESLTEVSMFTLVFTVARASNPDILEKIGQQFQAREHIAPLIRQEINESKTTSTDRQIGKSGGTSAGESKQQSKDLLRKALQFLTGTADDSSGSLSQFGRRPGVNIQQGTNSGWSESTSEGVQETGGVGTTQLNARLESLDKTLVRSMDHLQQTKGTGGFYGSVMVYADSEQTSKRVAKCLCATLSGADSYLRPMIALPFSGRMCNFQLRTNLSVHDSLRQVNTEIQILNCDQISHLLLLPDAELPGCKLKHSVFYGRPLTKENNGRGVGIGDIAFFEKTLKRQSTSSPPSPPLTLSSDDVCGHLLIVGTTGSGKTERAVHILNALPTEEFQVIVLETAKKTYRNKLRRGEKDPLIYTLGDSSHRPLRLNPFFFDPGTNLKRHISVLSDAMTELLPVEALIGPKLRQATEQCYKKCGWDIERGTVLDNGDAIYPDMIMFNSEVHAICDSLEDYGDEVKGNYKGALLNRAQIFLDDIYQDIFAFDGNLEFDEIFPRDTIIEMEEMPPSDINMPAFIISLILERLRAYRFRQSNAAAKKKKVVLVIEEAHNVLHRRFEQGGDEREAGRGKRLIEQVVRLLQEGRDLGIGVMVVDQSAQYLSDAVITNTNTKIVHRQEDGNEVKTIGDSLGLPEGDREDMHHLEDGECIVKTKKHPKPVKLSPIPAASLVKAREWEPFDSEQYQPTYLEHERQLTKLLGEKHPRQQQELLSQLIKKLNSNYDLIRFIIGRHFATTPGLQNRYDVLTLASQIRCFADAHRTIQWAMPLTNDQYLFVRFLWHSSWGAEFPGTEAEEPKAPEQAEINKIKISSPDWRVDQANQFMNRMPQGVAMLSYAEGVCHDRWHSQTEDRLNKWASEIKLGEVADRAKLEWLKTSDRYWSYFRPQLLAEYARATQKTARDFLAEIGQSAGKSRGLLSSARRY